MGFFSDLFSGGVEGEGFDLIPLTQEQQKAQDYIMDLINQKVTFDPRKIAEFSPAVQEAITQVNNIMSGGIPELNQAIKVVADRMTSPVEQVPGLEGLYQKTRELGSDLMGRTERGLQLTGNAPSESSAGEKVLGRTWQDIMNEFITSAFPFYQQGLQSKYNAPTELANLGIQSTTLPLSLATTIGALPMEKEQSELDAIFEALRKTKEFPYSAQAQLANSILNRTAFAYNPGTYQPSIFSQVAGPMAMLGSAALIGGGGGLTSMGGQGSTVDIAGSSFKNPMAVYGAPPGY